MGVFSLCFNLAGIYRAEAGFFSFIDKVLGFGSFEEDKIEVTPNSQTACLLEPVLNSDPTAGKGEEAISIVNQSALLASMGPLGSMVDVEEYNTHFDKISIYVVKEGDSLSQIAKMFGVSSNTIIWANNISRGDLIKTGQTLVILPVTGIKYTIKKGDTIASIAKKFEGDEQEIINYNDLPASGKLAVGDEIIIPDGVGEMPRPSSTSRSTVYGTGGPSIPGYYIRPVPLFAQKTQGLHGHNAVDLAASCDTTPIYAAASGRVIISRSSGWNGGYGNYIVIEHSNGTQTLYSHNSVNLVRSGQWVGQGSIIAYMGHTGRTVGPTGCHVHFEVRGAKNPF